MKHRLIRLYLELVVSVLVFPGFRYNLSLIPDPQASHHQILLLRRFTYFPTFFLNIMEENHNIDPPFTLQLKGLPLDVCAACNM